jgi:hypothetical protein
MSVNNITRRFQRIESGPTWIQSGFAEPPPRGLSGVIRRFAFRFSESSYGHWLPLMLADRVGMVEGVCEDLTRGHVPNIFRELGWKAEWQYNRKEFGDADCYRNIGHVRCRWIFPQKNDEILTTLVSRSS